MVTTPTTLRRKGPTWAWLMAGLLALGACGETDPAPLLSSSTTAQSTDTPTTAGVYYENCDEARDADAAPLRRGDPGYRSGLDGDGDGIACED